MTDQRRSDLIDSGDRLVRALVAAMDHDTELREAVLAFGRVLISAAAPTPQPVATPEPPRPPSINDLVPLVERTLRIGNAVTTVPVERAGSEAPAAEAVPRRDSPHDRVVALTADQYAPEVNLRTIARRCRIKADACEWAIDRRQRLDTSADFQQVIDPTDKALLGRARGLPECYLWMLDPYGPVVEDTDMDVLAGCYRNLARAAEFALHLDDSLEAGDAEPDAHLLHLIATSQSAIRRGLEIAGVQIVDKDQMQTYRWLRHQTAHHQVYIERHMTLADPADPTAWINTRDDLDTWYATREQRAADARRRDQWLGRVKYHAGLLRRSVDTDEFTHHWTRILETASEWVTSGLPASDKQLSRLLAELEDIDLPEEVEAGPAQQVLDAVDRYIALRERSTPIDTPRERRLTDEVQRVAALLKGRVVVMVGGDVRSHAKAALERDLELAELRWLATKSGNPLDRLEDEILRPEVSLVLLAIRWSSHVYGNLRDACVKSGVPLVRLKSGYNPSQVAHHVLEQADEALGRMQTPS